MNIEEAATELMYSIEAGSATILISSSGMGKSSILFQTFERLKREGAKKNERWGLGIIFAATQTPPDLIGYQFKGSRDYGDGQEVTVTDASVPLWMISVRHGDDPGGKPAWMYDKFYLIIEEYGQGEGDVKRALAEIFLHGGTAPWYLPPGSVRVAATNEGSRYGVTKDFDFVIYRRREIRITKDIKPVLKFMSKPYEHQGQMWLTTPVVKFWAERHPEHVFEDDPKEQGPKCSPRTLCDADRYLQVKAKYNNGTIPTDIITIEGLAGYIGMPATQSLVSDIQFRLELTPYAEVVADPTNAPIPGKADLKMLMAYELAYQTEPTDLAEVVAYMSRNDRDDKNGFFPKDMAVTFVTALCRRDYNKFVNTPAMQAWIARNGALVTLISSLARS